MTSSLYHRPRVPTHHDPAIMVHPSSSSSSSSFSSFPPTTHNHNHNAATYNPAPTTAGGTLHAYAYPTPMSPQVRRQQNAIGLRHQQQQLATNAYRDKLSAAASPASLRARIDSTLAAAQNYALASTTPAPSSSTSAYPSTSGAYVTRSNTPVSRMLRPQTPSGTSANTLSTSQGKMMLQGSNPSMSAHIIHPSASTLPAATAATAISASNGSTTRPPVARLLPTTLSNSASSTGIQQSNHSADESDRDRHSEGQREAYFHSHRAGDSTTIIPPPSNGVFPPSASVAAAYTLTNPVVTRRQPYKSSTSSSSTTNGSSLVLRTPAERAANPERLHLDRRLLTSIPPLESESDIRLLNCEHNSITRIDPLRLRVCAHLIYLDLYDNALTEISGVSAVPTLRVLMLGKNSISKIENLEGLPLLDVLDLHGNRITQIEHLGHLHHLRVLNLAGNALKTVENLENLHALTELNLRRNSITTITSVDSLRSLQRIYLSNNSIRSFDAMSGVFRIRALSELALDNNPVAANRHYREYLLEQIKALRHLDIGPSPSQHGTNDDSLPSASTHSHDSLSRSTSLSTLPPSTLLSRPLSEPPVMSEMKEERSASSASNGMHRGVSDTSAALAQSQVRNHHSSSREHVLREIEQFWLSQPDPSATGAVAAATRSSSADKLAGSDSGPTFHEWAENRGQLAVYGCNFSALTFPSPLYKDRTDYHMSLCNLHTLIFAYVDYTTVLLPQLSAIHTRCTKLQTLHLSHNRLHSLYQLDALSGLSLEEVVITNNAITMMPMYRSYAIFRLSPGRLDSHTVTTAELLHARTQFAPLRDVWQQSMVVRELGLAGGGHGSSANGKREEDGEGGGWMGGKVAYGLPLGAQLTTSHSRKWARKTVDELVHDAIDVSTVLDGFNSVWDEVVSGYIRSTLQQVESGTLPTTNARPVNAAFTSPSHGIESATLTKQRQMQSLAHGVPAQAQQRKKK